MKKFLLTILMVSFVINAQAWSEFCIDSLNYKITSDTLPYTVEVSDYTTGIVHAIIPETVTYSGITYSVTKIRFWAFLDCSSLNSVIIGDNVESIEYSAFEDCSSLNSVIIGDNVDSIDFYAFEDCSSLRSITIPKSVRFISHSVFSGCTSLESVIFESETPPYLSHSNFDNTAIPIYVPCGCVEAYKQGSRYWDELSNIQEHPAEYSITVYSSDKTMGVANVKNSICGNQISAKPNYGYHFVKWSDGNTDNPRSLELTKDTVLIAEFAQTFSGQCGDNLYWNYKNNTLTISGSGDMYDDCPWGLFAAEINDVVLPNAMTYIGSSAFYGCSSLASITIPNSVTCIGNSAFEDCSSLTSVTIPNSVTSIGTYAFYNCSSLTSVTIPNSVTSIGNSAFEDCSSLTSVTIPNSVTSIGTYAFYNCSSLTSVTIPNSVTSIGSSAFCNCEKLGTLVLGDKVNEIGDEAFYGCNKLYHIYCYAPEPPMVYERSFANYNVNLYVPCNYLDNYKYDRVFGTFRYIQCIESEDVTTNDVVVNPGANDVTITWPTEDNANSYTIVIEKDGEVFCTLTFNAEGQLLNIAFAPGRDGNHPVHYAEQAGKGYRFTVTSLESGTKYGYNIDVKDASNKTIKSHSGEFTTQSTTAVDNVTTNNANIQKIIRDGQFIIVRDGVEYNAMGQEM